MAPNTRYTVNSTSAISLNLGTIGPNQPADGNMLVALWFDTSVNGDPITAGESGWTLGGVVRSPLGGFNGDRRMQIAWAWRIWRTGDPTTVTPFVEPASYNNQRLIVQVMEDAGYVTAVTNSGLGGTAATGALAFPVETEALLQAYYAYPRSTGSGGQPVPSEIPSPPFGSSANPPIGTGFNNMNGLFATALVAGEVFGPYPTSTFNDAWVTLLLAVLEAVPSPPPPPPPELGPVPQLDSPVTVRFSEHLTGTFADPSIDVSFFQNVDLPIGGRYALGDHLSGDDWYTFSIRDRTKSRGIIAYNGETLLARLGRATPRESLILIAGQDDVPDPLDLRECLRRFLIYYGVPFVDDLPVFFLRAGDAIVAPTVDAFVIQPDPQNPESIYTLIERFFGPFRGYTFRSNAMDQLVVTPPAWVDTIGLRFHLYRVLWRGLAPVTVHTRTYAWVDPARAPHVTYTATVNGAPYMGSLPPLEIDIPEQVTIGELTFEATWIDGGARLRIEVLDYVALITSTNMFDATFTAMPDPGSGLAVLTLTDEDLGPDEIETSSADSVINQAIVNVRRRSFEPDQQLMQAAALVLRGPSHGAATVFGPPLPFGPMVWAPDTPGGFLELANTHAQDGTWFWPIDPLVVIQPGGAVTVLYDVQEWAEQWRIEISPIVPFDDAFMANTYTGSATLPANGTEVELFQLQFPRQTTNFAPSPYGARGTVYGRWRAGPSPGIELRIGNARFAEHGYLAEFLIFGQTTHFLWGVQITLNGTGTTFTVGDLETYRFGFARAEDGLWEGGADVPGLTQSQELYPNRIYSSEELPYEVTAETAMAMARGIVEENMVPKVVYQVPIAASRGDGYAAGPWHLGRATDLRPSLGVQGRVVALDYTETNTPGGTSSGLMLEVEVSQAPHTSLASPTRRTYRRAAYRVTSYQPAEEV